MDIGDQGCIEQGFRLYPEIVSCASFALGIGDQGRYQFQNILLGVEVGKGVITHGLLKVDGVEDLDPIPFSLQELSAFDEDAALGVGDHIAGMALHKIRLDEKARLAAAGTADDQHIFVAGIRRIFRATRHHEPFRLGQDDVVLKHRVDIGRDVFRRSP